MGLGWWCQEGPGRGFLFLLAKISQNPVDNVLLLDASDDFDRPTAATASGEFDKNSVGIAINPDQLVGKLNRAYPFPN